MNTIGLIAAMPQESAALLRLIKAWKWVPLGTLRAKSFELSGQACLLVTSGMGAQRASAATRELLEVQSVRLLISFGIAGALNSDLQIGDTIAVQAVSRLDQGIPGPLQPLADWPAAALTAASRALASRGARLLPGTALTTSGAQGINTNLAGIINPILEMETDGVARLAAQKGIPLLSLRAISDGPFAPLPFDLGEMIDEHANLRAGRLLQAFVRHPSLLFQASRMVRNTRIAADHAAIALIAALSQTPA